MDRLYRARRPRWDEYCERFNASFRRGLPDEEIFNTLEQGRIVIEQWPGHDNTTRAHRAPGYQPPAPKATFRWTGGHQGPDAGSGRIAGSRLIS